MMNEICLKFSPINVSQSKALVGRLAALLLFIALIVPHQAHALPEKQAWVGGLFGLSVPNANNTSSRPLYGITGGAKLGDELGIGAYFLSSKKDEDVNSQNTNQNTNQKANFDYDLYGVQASYHFEGDAAGVFFGGRLGMSKMNNAGLSTSPFHYGAVVGVDKLLTDFISIGGELSWMAVQSSSGTKNGQSVSTDTFSMLNFLVALKLWF